MCSDPLSVFIFLSVTRFMSSKEKVLVRYMIYKVFLSLWLSLRLVDCVPGAQTLTLKPVSVFPFVACVSVSKRSLPKTKP